MDEMSTPAPLSLKTRPSHKSIRPEQRMRIIVLNCQFHVTPGVTYLRYGCLHPSGTSLVSLRCVRDPASHTTSVTDQAHWESISWMSSPVDFSGGQDEELEPATPTRDLLADAERLRVLTLVSASIAHDLNNLLMVIENVAAARLEAAGESGDAQADLILRTARSAAKLSSQLLTLGRPVQSEPRLFDLNELIAEQLAAIRAVVGKTIDVVFEAGAQIEPVFADAGQMRDVLLNLAVNAREAMPTGGTLSVSTHAESLTQPQGELLPGTYARISLRDTGVGMDEQTAERVFEPYFTTKDRRTNSGLGLAAVRDLLHKFGGGIAVDSTPGQGTCFHLYLPMIAKPGNKAHEGVVLLVEDSEEVRELLRHFLLSQGYTVVAAPGAEAMLELEKSLQAEPWVVIADLLIPGIGGNALVQQLQRKYPQMHAVMISGNAKTEDASPAHDAVFLQKPFSLQSLAAVLARFPATKAERAKGFDRRPGRI